MVNFLSSGYASGFMSGSFTAEAVGLELSIERISKNVFCADVSVLAFLC